MAEKAFSYAVIRIAPKSTKAPDDSDQATTDKQNDSTNFMLPSGEEIKIEDNQKKRPLSHHERCKRIIDKAFGNTDNTDDPDHVTSEQYCSHTINIEETKREIIESEKATLKLKEIPIGTPILPDDRTQYGIFKMSRELIFEDEADEPGTEEVTPVKETSKIRVSSVREIREPDLSKSLENLEKAHEAPKQVGQTEFEKDLNNQVNNKENEESRTLSDEDAQAMELLKQKYQMHHDNVNILETPKIIKATTANEVEEELSQKIEEIHETPLVEDMKPKIEGFNTTSKVLADLKPTYTISSDNNKPQIDDYTDAVDEVAKRCLQSPVGKIDEMLINEMENLDVRTNCNTGSKSPSMDIEDELVRMNAIKNQLKDSTPKDDAVDMSLRSAEPTREIKPMLPDLNEQSDNVVLKSCENLFVKAELIDEAPRENDLERVSAEQKVSENVLQLNASAAETENTSTEVIKPCNDFVMPIEPQSMAASDTARLPSITKENELPPLKYHKRKIVFRTNKKTLNPEDEPVNTGFVIDDVSPIASYNQTYPKDRQTDPFSLEHPSPERKQILKPFLSENPSSERNDAKDEKDMSENLHHLQVETDATEAPKTAAEIIINAVPDNCRILDDTCDEQPETYDTTKTSDEIKNRDTISNNLSDAEELPRNIEHVNVVGTRIAAHDPHFLENVKRDIAAPLRLTEPRPEINYVKDVSAEQKMTENVNLVNVEAGELEVEKTPFEPPSNVIDDTRISNNTCDKQVAPVYNYNQAAFLKEDNRSESDNNSTSHNLTFTNVDHHHQQSFENKHGENTFGFQQYGQPTKDQSDFKKELEDAVVSTQNAVNRLFSKIPFTNFRLPTTKWDITNLVKRRDKAVPPPDKVYLEQSITIEAPHARTELDTGKAIFPNAILNQSDLACITSPKPEGTNIVDTTENMNIENLQAERSMDEGPVLVIGNEKLKQPELDLKCDEICTVSQRPVSSGVNAYAFKKGTELVDAYENDEDFQAKRSLDYDLVMESEKIKQHKLNLICEETCATSPKPVGLRDIALAYEKGTNLVDENVKDDNEFDQVLRFEDCADLVTESENSKQHELDPRRHETCTTSLEQDDPSDIGYSYDKGTNLVIATENIDDFQAKRSLDDLVMECENLPQEEIQAVVGVQEQPTLDNLPSLAEDVALSELLRRVRQRSRIMAFTNDCKTLAVEVVPAEGKCNRSSPRCPPTAPRSPPNNPIPPPSFGLPMLKRRPPACKPRRKPSTTKCSACDSSKLGPPQNLDMFCETDEACGLLVRSSQVDLTEVVIDRLQTLGRTLAGVLRQVKSQVETMFARDYEPWVPIPSWPIPKKVEKPKLQPGYHGVPPCVTGCPVSPKPNVSRNPEPRCYPRPCEGFPRRSFSMLDCFTVSLGENQVYDLGQF